MWKLLLAIPGITKIESVDTSDLSLVSYRDERYKQIIDRNINLGRFLNSFHDCFGGEILPSIIITDTLQRPVDPSILTNFRNIIAIPSVIRSRMHNYRIRRMHYVPFTDHFEFCFVTPSIRNCNKVSYTTAAEGGIRLLKDFSCNPSLSIIRPQLFKIKLDSVLTNALIRLFDDRRRLRDIREFKEKIFRSLELLFYACRSPSANLGSKYDFGFIVSLWVSAFEILCHPLDRNVHYGHVERLIDDIPWINPLLRRKKYKRVDKTYGKKRTNHDLCSLPNQIYSRLRKTRNNVLHGDPLRESIEPIRRKNWGHLIIQIPALYRCLLLNELVKRDYGEYPDEDSDFREHWENCDYYEKNIYEKPI